MADPLGLIGASNQSPLRAVPAPSKPADPNAASFKDLLMENIDQVNKLQQDATRAIEDLQSGKRSDLESVLLATQKADTAFQALQAVRNKFMTAFDEIKQMRV